MDQVAAKRALLASIKQGLVRLDEVQVKTKDTTSDDEIAAIRQEIAKIEAEMSGALDQVNRRLDAPRTAWHFLVHRDEQGLMTEVTAEPIENN